MNQIFINRKSYFIKEELGQGSFGKVYKAQDPSNNHAVAIKVQQQISQHELDLLHKFKELKFKNLVNILDFQICPNQIFIVMELGLISLQDKIQKSKIPFQEARYVMQQICNGLQELHSLGLAHRDLKPENILIFTLQDQAQTQEIYKICDFGTTKDFQNMKTPYIGTPYYLAPEQLVSNPFNQKVNYNQSVDIWAFGAVVYELFTNIPLFNGKTVQEIYLKIMELPIEEEIKKLQHLETKYQNLLINMLQRNPQKRITIQDIKKELSQIQNQNLVTKQAQQATIQKVCQPGNIQMQQTFQRGRQMNAEDLRSPQQNNINPTIKQQLLIAGKNQNEFQRVAQPAFQPANQQKPIFQPTTLQKPIFQPINLQKPNFQPATLQKPMFQPKNQIPLYQHAPQMQNEFLQDNNQQRGRSQHKTHQQKPRPMFLSPQ